MRWVTIEDHSRLPWAKTGDHWAGKGRFLQCFMDAWRLGWSYDALLQRYSLCFKYTKSRTSSDDVQRLQILPTYPTIQLCWT